VAFAFAPLTKGGSSKKRYRYWGKTRRAKKTKKTKKTKIKNKKKKDQE